MSTTTANGTAHAVSPTARRSYTISVGLTTLFIFLQSLTAGEFITDGLAKDAKATWTELHGLTAYPVMVFALIAAGVAITQLRQRRASSSVPWRCSLLRCCSGCSAMRSVPST